MHAITVCPPASCTSNRWVGWYVVASCGGEGEGMGMQGGKIRRYSIGVNNPFLTKPSPHMTWRDKLWQVLPINVNKPQTTKSPAQLCTPRRHQRQRRARPARRRQLPK